MQKSDPQHSASLTPKSSHHDNHPYHLQRPPSSSSTSSPNQVPPRLPQAVLFIVTLILICVAEFGFPGGLTPRRAKQQILASRVDEVLDIINETDPYQVVSETPLPIDEVHRLGLPHRGSWLFAFDSHLRLLLSWRAPAMKTCPMTWSPLGEHAVANETFEHAATRGLAEEARFIARPRVYPIGAPFLFRASYAYANSSPDATRTDVQWTQTFVSLPRGDALDFRTLDDRDAQAEQAAGENSRYQGMSLTDVVKHAVERPEYFCMPVLSDWILRAIPLVVRAIKTNEKRLFKYYLRDDWAQLVQSGAPVCCTPTEHEASLQTVNVSLCGVTCSAHTIDASDAVS